MGDHISLFDRPRLNEEKIAGKRWYETPRGVTVPSVTTFLDAMDKPNLDRWKVRNDREQLILWVQKNRALLAAVNEERTAPLMDNSTLSDTMTGLKFFNSRATDVGNLVHLIFERLMLGLDPQIPEGWECVRDVYDLFCEEFEFDVIAIEPQLMNYTFEYAGSADAILNLKRRDSDEEKQVTVIDWKSGSGLYGSVAYQTMAYGKAEFMLDPITGKEIEAPEVTATMGVWLRPNGYAAHPLEFSDEVWTAVRAARYLFGIMSREWGLKGKAVNPNPVKKANVDWPELP